MLEISAMISLMIQHNGGQPEKIYHMMKIYSFARIIAIEEGVGDEARELIEAAAVLCELGENSAESAVLADMLLLNLGCERNVIESVCRLILGADGNDELRDIRQQIIEEARFLVSAYEQKLDKETIVETLNQKFVTNCGKQYLCNIFSVGNRRKSDNNIFAEGAGAELLGK